MKTFKVILDNLSASDIKAFRSFLLSGKKGGEGKKLMLFDEWVNFNHETKKENSTPFLDEKYSKQAYYQLRKRLWDDLIMFFFLQNKENHGDDKLKVEMDCHKNLCCFTIFIDKKLLKEAHSLILEIIDKAIKHQLPHIYIEAIALYARYFPFSEKVSAYRNSVRSQIKLLHEEIDFYCYLNRYQKESIEKFHISDEDFREKLLKDQNYYADGENRWLLEEFFTINKMFQKRDYKEAYIALMIFSNGIENHQVYRDKTQVRGLIYIELIKCCLCLGNNFEGSIWIQKAEAVLGNHEYWKIIICELKFLLAFRSSNLSTQFSILQEAAKIEIMSEHKNCHFKWQAYSIFSSFQKKDFKEVIKAINAKSFTILKHQNWLILMKFLELISILELKDLDWFQFKLETISKKNKMLSTQYRRMHHLLNMLKDSFITPIGKSDALEISKRVEFIETNFPWHPLGIEIFDINKTIGYLLPLNLISRP
ncbi:hypothetical protein [Rhodonellum sp.]|uniref:hypothetical protein n=1 Tax=Rhodonellum sp. TaxID=2231180 RepID=UPI002720D09D|nr:hypothetical protein [Rhodonellum sp.]MDO9553363.1 hypothetical protein [Rhodonellum sp.]